MGLFEKLRQRRLKKKIERGEFNLTPRGKYFLEYCKKIASKQWEEKDYIEAYDKEIVSLVNTCNEGQCFIKMTKEMMAEILIGFLERGR